MKKLFILFLMTNFYNIHTAEYNQIYRTADSRLTEDQKLHSVLSAMVQDVFTKKNSSELSFSSVNDQRGNFLHISSGLFTTYSFTFPQGSPALQAATAQLALYNTQGNDNLTKLKRIIRLEEFGRTTAFSNAPQIGNW